MSAAILRIVREFTAERPDEELVALALDGDDGAYAALVNRHQGALYRHARGMGLDHDTSLDLVQDAFVRAHERLRGSDPARFGAWVFRIARNLCLDYLKNVRRQTVPLSALPDPTAIPADPEIPSDEAELLRDALASLSPALREAFLLKHDAGYTYDEIAGLTDTSPSAAKMRVHRARESLREFLVANGMNAA